MNWHMTTSWKQTQHLLNLVDTTIVLETIPVNFKGLRTTNDLWYFIIPLVHIISFIFLQEIDYVPLKHQRILYHVSCKDHIVIILVSYFKHVDTKKLKLSSMNALPNRTSSVVSKSFRFISRFLSTIKIRKPEKNVIRINHQKVCVVITF